MSTDRPAPPTYEQVLLESQGDGNMEIFSIQNSGVRNLDYVPYAADDRGPPPTRQAFVASTTEEASPLPEKGTPTASPNKTPVLPPPPEPVLPAAVAAAAAPPPPPPEPQAPKPKPQAESQPQPKPKPKPSATPATPSRGSNKTAPKTTGTSAPSATVSLKGFKNKEDRRAMIRRLYLLLLALQLAAIGSVSIFVFVTPITRWMKKDGLPLLYASIGVFLWAFIVLAVILPSKKKVEGNGVRFIIFAFTYACVLGAVSGHFATYIVLAASVIMGLTYLSVVIFSIKADINMKKGLIFVTVVVLLVTGVICIGTYFTFGLYKLAHSGIGGGIALVFCELFTVSIQLMLSKDNHGFTKENPCLAFFNIFSHMKDAIIFGVRNLDYVPYAADDRGPPPTRQAFVASTTEEASPLPEKGTPTASPNKTPVLPPPPEPVLPSAVAAAAPPPPPEPQAPKPKPQAESQPQPKPKPKPSATPATPSRGSNKTAPKTTGTSAPSASVSLKGFKNKEDRRAMIRRLYLLLLALQLAAIGSVSIFVFITPITRWMKKDGLPLLYASIGVFLWAFIVLAVILPSKKNVEGNGVRFIIFAFTYACVLGAVSGHFATYIVLAASVIMGLTYLSVVIFSIKADINMKKGLIFVTVVVLLVTGVICIGTYFAFGLYKLAHSGIGGGIALIFCELFTVSIQLMLSKDNHGFTKENPCLAFFNIFSHMKDAIIFGITQILCCAI